MKYTLKNWQKTWWKKEFGEVYYRTFNPLFTEKRIKKEVNFIKKVIPLKKEYKILDLACGHGRHAIELAKQGFNIIGLDYSKFFLNIARKNADKTKARIKFIHGDMLKLEYNQEFDTILFMFSSFGYFKHKENQIVLSKIYQALKPGGNLLIDVVNADVLFAEIVYEGEKLRTGIYRRIKKSKVGTYNLTDTDLYYAKEQLVHLHRIWKKNSKQGTFDYFMVHYKIDQHKKMLKKQGFKIIKTWGDYDFRVWSKSSWRTIILAQKPISFLKQLTNYISQFNIY